MTDERTSPEERSLDALSTPQAGRSVTHEVALRFAKTALVGGALLVLLLLGLVPCPVALFLRVPCPGCGMTRATLRLLHGDLAGALAFHPLVLVALPCALLFFGVNTLVYLRTGTWGYVDRQMGKKITVIATLLMLLSLGVWISRFFGAFGGPVPV